MATGFIIPGSDMMLWLRLVILELVRIADWDMVMSPSVLKLRQ